MLALRIDRNQAIVAVPIQKRDLVRALQYFESKPARVVARDAAENAEALRIDGRGEVVLQRGFARRRQRELKAWQVLGDIPTGFCISRSLPVAA
jgi:hypothetical protein